MMNMKYFGALDINEWLQAYRKEFLSKRKHINKYKKSPKGTPEYLDRVINAFDRKIKGISIFTEDTKKEYFEGIEYIFSCYYDKTFEPKKSKMEAYYSYLATEYIVFGKIYKSISFKEFVKSGTYKYYR